jgi:hypothetical protein
MTRRLAASGQDEPETPRGKGTQLTWTVAGPFPERAPELNGTPIANEADSPPAMVWVRMLDRPITPCAVVAVARHAARPAWLESFPTTKVTLAIGTVVGDR